MTDWFGYPRRRWCPAAAGWLALSLMLSACGTPVSVEHVDARTVQTELTSNALTTGKLSGPTQIVLRRLDLLSVYGEKPDVAIQALTQIVASGAGYPDQLFALAEMAFLEAERTNSQPYFMASVIYAYAFLFPDKPENRPSPFDPRLRTAADLYNRALTRGLATADGLHVDLRAGEFPLPFGTLSVSFDQESMQWAGRRLTGFVSAAEMRIKGLQNRYRETGLGAPLAAELAPVTDQSGILIARAYKVPVTVLLRLDITPDAIASGRFTGRLVLFPGNEERKVEIGGQQVPLEIEPSASLAYGLSNPAIWKSEIAGFLRGDYFKDLPSQLVGLDVYRPGRIPVVLVHGTASSAGRWADLINDLQNDPAIREKFQFWLFTYSTGNPIALSALELREQIASAVARLDPSGRDPALHNMVVIGHSQGGLLTKSLVVDAGNRLYDEYSTRPFSELNLSAETRDLLGRALFIKPMPDVGRVIFMATPHRGSFVASFSIVHLIGRLVTLPLSITKVAAEVFTGNSDAMRFEPEGMRLGSIYGMTPGSPYITALSSLPVTPKVAAHSIIAVDGDGPIETGDDGVVAYRSAHIEEAVSELVVRSGHSVQSNPRAVAEVRRILLLHWAQVCGTGCPNGTLPAIAANDAGPRATLRRSATARR